MVLAYFSIILLMQSGGILLEIGPSVSADDKNVPILLLHNNDMHARFEETSRNSGVCKDSKHINAGECFGGFARIAHVVRHYRQLAKNGHENNNGSIIGNVLFLNAGDTYTGTVWFNVHKWRICADFINLLQPDAICLGNHEFDNGISGLNGFLTAVQAPIVAANIRTNEETDLDVGISRSTVLSINGTSVGIIGYITKDTVHLSSPGRIQFDDEIEEIRKESERLDKHNVKIIIALGHSGFTIDKEIALKVPLVDVVVGGHTNTFLWNGIAPDLENPEGEYPFVVQQSSGKQVPVVQAYAYTKYLGKLSLVFDETGDLKEWSGQPILLNKSIEQDADVLELLEQYRPEVDKLLNNIIGTSAVQLDGAGEKCRRMECNFGNLIADSFVYFVAANNSINKSAVDFWSDYPISLVNGGGIRNTIEHGNISQGELLSVLPFDNKLVICSLNGSDLIETLEISVRSNGETSRGEFLQVSGLRVVYDLSRKLGQRVVKVMVRCGHCEVPIYEPILLNATYNVVITTFLLNGGDGHNVLRRRSFHTRILEGIGDFDATKWYISGHSPVYPEIEGRIEFITHKDSGELSFKPNLYLTSLVLSWTVILKTL